MWGGGRFMHFGEAIDDDRFVALIRSRLRNRHSHFPDRRRLRRGRSRYAARSRAGRNPARQLLPRRRGRTRFLRGPARRLERLSAFHRAPTLRKPGEYASYLREATEKSLARCRADRFDLLLLHNPDASGYTTDAVWNGMAKLKDAGLTSQLGIAPGPANGFTLDLILWLERFQGLIDWAMIILNPLEPWPGASRCRRRRRPARKS